MSTIPPLINDTNANIAVEDEEKAELLNNYFTGISTIPDPDDDLPNFSSRTEHEITDFEITQENIIDIIKSLKINKAPGIDSISHHILKNTVDTISIPLLLFNKCIEYSQFPNVWNKAHVMLISKKGDKHSPSNYRPIALLSSVGKIFESIIHKHLHNFMIETNLLCKYQSGLLPNNSTVYQLLEIYHYVFMGIEERKNTCLVFCDISKAFDWVWHKEHLKLEVYGVKGSLLQLLNNYLSERQQAVFVKNLLSQFQTVNTGVP